MMLEEHRAANASRVLSHDRLHAHPVGADPYAATGSGAEEVLVTLDEFFEGYDASRALFDAVSATIGTIGPAELRITKSQAAFRRRTSFAMVWMPETYLGRGAPLVLTIALRREDTSPRWKQVVEPAPGRFTHHLELNSAADVDDEVRGWLREAWEHAA